MARRGLPLLLVLAIVAASAPASLGARTAPPRAAVPGTGCEVFPADNAWNMDVSKLPRHRRSDVWKKAMHAGTTKLHPDFGPPAYGIPFDVVDGSATGFVDIDFVYAEESDPGPYPFSGSTPIEGGSDHHALTIDSETCVLYELFAAQWSGGDPRAGSGAIFDLDSNKLRPAEWTSADAAGLPIFPGLVRYDEVMAGRIGHAIRVTADCTSRRYLWPARHQAGSPDTRCPPMGARFRLKKGFSMAGYSENAKTILKAFKHYGLIVADNGRDWYFQGAVDDRWTNGLMSQLKRIPAGAFVAVDTSRCKVAPGSARFAYGPGCPAPGKPDAGHCTRPRIASSFAWVSASTGGSTTSP